MNAQPEPGLVAVAAAAESQMARWTARWSSSFKFTSDDYCDLFLFDESIRHVQVFLKDQEVEMKLRGPEALFN